MAIGSPARFADAPALSQRARAILLVVIVLAHALLAIGLIRAFGSVRTLIPSVGTRAVVVAATIPDRPRPATHRQVPQRASGDAGRRAQADAIIASPAVLPVTAPVAPIVAGTGSAVQSGASDQAAGPGAGDTGNGSGARFAATKPTKIAGDLTEADYPKAGRARRLGTAVIVLLTVAGDGHVSACRVFQPSGDPQADAVTCTLARERFRFQPARDRNGNPVEATFGWQQRFFWK